MLSKGVPDNASASRSCRSGVSREAVHPPGTGISGICRITGFAAYAAPTKLAGIVGEAPAEHGSALRRCSLPLAKRGGGVGRGVAFGLFRRCQLRGLRRSHKAGRHCGRSPCRAWLGTTPLLPPFGEARGRAGEGGGFWAFQALPASRLTLLPQSWPALLAKPLPSMARHYAVAPSLWRSQGEGWGGVGFWAFQALPASRLTPAVWLQLLRLAKSAAAIGRPR